MIGTILIIIGIIVALLIASFYILLLIVCKAIDKLDRDTMNCSNLMQVPTLDAKGNVVPEAHPWLTPNDARKAVEIAREEMIEKACDAYCKVCGHYAHTVPTHICRHDCRYYSDFKKAMKDE